MWQVVHNVNVISFVSAVSISVNNKYYAFATILSVDMYMVPDI
jgi:hypothetical protein